ncbi:MAG TPA: LytTR family DNA-binding domain-containing protein [Puia sp.]|nr:LytTR family DNA-binding domain-containing protein [Puia sp.]
MIRTILVDDEIDSILILKNLLGSSCPEVEVVGEADSVETALQTIKQGNPDLVLLDISLKNKDAFELLGLLGPVGFQLIFVTAWDQHAIRAFKYNALDYLLKPVDGDELRKAIDRVARRMQEGTERTDWKTVLDSIASLQQSQQKMAIPTMTGLSFIHMGEILRFEAKGSCTAIIMDNGGSLVSTRSIKEYEALLPGSVFYRVHYSHIINMNKVQKYLKGRGGSLIMDDGRTIDVSSRRKDEFLKRLMK